VAEGRITPSEAIAVTGLIEIATRAIPAPEPLAPTPGVNMISVRFVKNHEQLTD
jgi:hypothetical protein